MSRFNIFSFLKMLLACCCVLAVTSASSDPVIVSREEWQARAPKSIENMANPVPYVVIHHSYLPPACHNLTDCIKAMHWMQDLHQQTNGWSDLGYNFAVGGDGRAYEGRGWSRVGAHAPFYNSKSIGICIIGDWRVELPPEDQLTTVHQLIQKGVREGYIQKDYKLVGHRQVRAGTECPGERLFQEIHKWQNFCEQPDEVAVRTNNTWFVKTVHDNSRDKEDKDEDTNDNGINRLEKRTV
ncbi:peptidoglycan-recognition protein LB-like isoform X1 [Diabrotica undecimpunctata]|uniref:peptidoglycan-recognition protein LB-like isoform X1 n=1 Tax=Diabrotica undecimpunctata TaxID=50387 RepID=UPI003B636A66